MTLCSCGQAVLLHTSWLAGWLHLGHGTPSPAQLVLGQHQVDQLKSHICLITGMLLASRRRQATFHWNRSAVKALSQSSGVGRALPSAVPPSGLLAPLPPRSGSPSAAAVGVQGSSEAGLSDIGGRWRPSKALSTGVFK